MRIFISLFFQVPASTTENEPQREEIKKFIEQLIELARAYLKIDKDLVFVREKSTESNPTGTTSRKSTFRQAFPSQPAFGFGFQGSAKARKAEPNTGALNAGPYLSSAFELSLRFWLDDFKEEYSLKDYKVFNRNPLLKMMIEELQEDGRLTKALLEQDDRLAFHYFETLNSNRSLDSRIVLNFVFSGSDSRVILHYYFVSRMASSIPRI